jgi:hypothetical protein
VLITLLGWSASNGCTGGSGSAGETKAGAAASAAVAITVRDMGMSGISQEE